MSGNKLWESHRIVIPEARQMIINQCCDCHFFVTSREPGKTAKAACRHPEVSGSIGQGAACDPLMELMKSKGKEGLGRILEKGNPLAQACEMWLPRQKRKRPQAGA